MKCPCPTGSGELEKFRHVLGGSKLAYSVRPSRHCHESVFYVEGLAFPDLAFSGLVSLHVTLLESPEKVRPGGTGSGTGGQIPNSICIIPGDWNSGDRSQTPSL